MSFALDITVSIDVAACIGASTALLVAIYKYRSK